MNINIPGVIVIALVSMAGCDNSSAPSEPTTRPAPSSSTSGNADVSDNGSLPPAEWSVDDMQPAPAPAIEDSFQAFLAATEEDQADIAFTMEPTRENAVLVARLMSANISEDVKLGLLSAMEDGDYADILPALQIALLDPSPEVAIAAINILGDSERPDVIPLLQPIAENAVNEDVRAAAEAAIDTLQL